MNHASNQFFAAKNMFFLQLLLYNKVVLQLKYSLFNKVTIVQAAACHWFAEIAEIGIFIKNHDDFNLEMSFWVLSPRNYFM